MNELMMTGWLPEVGRMRGCRQAYRSCVRSEIGRRDLGGREGLGGRFEGAEGASARRRGRHARLSGWGRALGCGEVGERSGRALGEVWEAEIEPRWGRGPRSGRDLGEVRIKSSGVWNF